LSYPQFFPSYPQAKFTHLRDTAGRSIAKKSCRLLNMTLWKMDVREGYRKAFETVRQGISNAPDSTAARQG
jgi:hypothetical protein